MSAAAATKSHQSCSTLWDPIDGSPPGSPIPRILQARTLEWVAIAFSDETVDWFQIGKGVNQGCMLPPCLFNLYAKYIMQNARLDEAQAGSRLPGEISITTDMQMTPPLWQKVKKN